MTFAPTSLPCRLPLLPLACAAALCCATTAVSAQSSLYPYYFQASETLAYDSNIFRLPEQLGERSDVISTTALTVGFAQPIGRQRVSASATISQNFYRSDSNLNSFGYNLIGGLDWEAFSKWSGTVRVNASQGQTSFDQYGALSQSLRTRNLERSQSIDARARYGGAAILSAELLGNYTHINYSSSSFNSRAQDSHMLGAGLRYHPGGFWTLGVTVRDTHGSYPSYAVSGNSVVVGDSYERLDYDFSADYQATGFSTFFARLTYTKENHDLVNSRDFSGLTGALTWNYQLTGKIKTSVTASRNTGSGTSYVAAQANAVSGTTVPTIPTTTTATYLTDSQLTDQISVQAMWAATAKVSVTVGGSYSRDRYDNVFVLSGAQSAGDGRGNTRQLFASASYAISRIWSATCGVGRLSRSSGVILNGTNYDYDANTAFCSAQLLLR